MTTKSKRNEEMLVRGQTEPFAMFCAQTLGKLKNWSVRLTTYNKCWFTTD